MPQISKIRIVNFRYNDGNRFIPDELYDLSSPQTGEAFNSLFHLNNGGGKTVLVQLMMQPVHPKAMAGGRRIEDYFSHPGDHSFILLEWNMDGSKEKLLTGIALAASSSGGGEESQRGNSVKYYTFQTTYGEHAYTRNTIAALELSQNENGKYVPAPYDFMKEEAKKSRGLIQYYSSEESSRWTSLLSEYGIYRSEWETVTEALNRDEGGLNQYFDEAKTSDKLIAKFFIPAIEQKLLGASSPARGADGSLETMLINYARSITDKEEVLKERDTNNRLLGELSDLCEKSAQVQKANAGVLDAFQGALRFQGALKKRLRLAGEEAELLTQEVGERERDITHIRQEEASKTYYEANDQYKQEEELYHKAKASLEETSATLEEKKREEELLICADLKGQIGGLEARMEELKRLIDEKEHHSENAQRLASLKYSVLVTAGEEARSLESHGKEIEEALSEEEKKLEGCVSQEQRASSEEKKAAQQCNLAISRLEASKDSSDQRLRSLELDLTRRLDGFYAQEELKSEEKSRRGALKELEKKEEKLKENIEKLEQRREEIPNEVSQLLVQKQTLQARIEEGEGALKEYEQQLEKLTQLCAAFSLEPDSLERGEEAAGERTYLHAIFSGSLKLAVQRELGNTDARIRQRRGEIHTLEQRLSAASEGTLHILPDIMEYVRATSVAYQTGEEYLSSLIQEGTLPEGKIQEVLNRYPEIAYSLLFSKEKELKRLLSAGNLPWLPALVPLFTKAQVEEMLQGNRATSSFLSSYDRSFFADRDGYLDEIRQDLLKAKEQEKRFASTLERLQEEKRLCDLFTYPREWEGEEIKRLTSQREELSRLEKDLALLSEEKESLKAQLHAKKEELEKAQKQEQTLGLWLFSFGELLEMISREEVEEERYQEAYKLSQQAKALLKEAEQALAEQREQVSSLKGRREEILTSYRRVQGILEKVSGASQAPLIEGSLDQLTSQYSSLLENQSKDLSELDSQVRSLQEDRQSLQAKLLSYPYDPGAYEDLPYSGSAFARVKEERQALEREKEKQGAAEADRRVAYSLAEKALDQAEQGLTAFPQGALPLSEIGDNFAQRMAQAQERIRILQGKGKALMEERGRLDRLFDQAEEKLSQMPPRLWELLKEQLLPLKEPQPLKEEIALSQNPAQQWRELSGDLTRVQEEFQKSLDLLQSRLGEVILEYRDQVLGEILGKLRGIKGMLEDDSLKGDRFTTVSESLLAMSTSLEKMNRRIETDLKELENDFKDLVDQCFLQGKRMYTDLRMIAASSRAHIYEGTPQTQMVKIDLPEEKELSQEGSRSAIQEELRLGAEELKTLLRSSAEEKVLLKKARAIVSSERLLHRYIREDSIPVRVYKIDLNRENSSYKRWEDTLRQSSGAEKFVVFFSVVLTLMNYTRAASGVISKNQRSVLILDNPFGKITSAHLLKPMFDIARHFKVQLICLTDINKSDVTSCFECVIKLVIKTQSLSGLEITTHEGNEKIEHGYYKVMNGQMSLF